MASESKDEVMGGAGTDAGGEGGSATAHADMDLAQAAFELTLPSSAGVDVGTVKEVVLKHIQAKNMVALYTALAGRMGWSEETAEVVEMRKAIAAKVAGFDASIEEAKEKFGDVEVYERQKARADFLASTWDKAAALTAYAVLNERTLSTGQKVDIAMVKARLALRHGDWLEAKERIGEAKELNEKGGDWDRRNRLKVYEALQLMSARDFKAAATLLLDSVATFTAVEVVSYTDFIFFTVIAGLKSLDRVTLKRKVVDSPDVLSVIGDVPHLASLLNSFYEGRYHDFLQALTGIYPLILRNRYLSRHAPYLLRELRLAAYVQFLESYRSVTMAGMARVFGVSVGFLDTELSTFIASGRIRAKIDAVAGVVETMRPDAKNAQYVALIKSGDALLNKVQRLSRVITL